MMRGNPDAGVFDSWVAEFRELARREDTLFFDRVGEMVGAQEPGGEERWRGLMTAMALGGAELLRVRLPADFECLLPAAPSGGAA